MTDTSSIVATHSTPPQYPVTAPSLASPTVNGLLSDTHLEEDEESYTIKCICPFADDDGSTVQCEECETWQHIICYYPTKKVPETHKCNDCDRRTLDAKRATERQRKSREQIDGGDRKTKRPVTKSHKKRTKDSNATGEQTNGWHTHDRHDSASVGRDQPPPAKRPKTSHRTSGSVSSQTGTPVLQPDSRRRAGSSAQKSPTKSPLNPTFPPIPTYTTEFLELYDRDEGNVSMQANIFNNIALAGTLASWVQDPDALANGTGVQQPHTVFTRLDQPLDSSSWPRITRESAVEHSSDYGGKNPTWQFLKTKDDVRKDEIIGELKGQIGDLRDYSLDPSNRWKELQHPEPFVFFHPLLPIYVDCRKEGTEFRYARRACDANMGMKTIITNESEFHFCFTAKRDIPAGSELTVMWYLPPSLFNQSLNEANASDEDLDPKRQWISRVLANFGGCACSSSHSCFLSPWDKRRSPRAIEAAAKQVNGKRRHTKSKHAISPLGTGQANNSRAGSETLRQQDEDDPTESRSTSGSLRSKPGSRDQSPMPSDHGPGSTLSTREKRKIAAAEKNFERLEQDAHGHRKKKRTSGGSTLSTPGINTSKHMGHLTTSASNPATPSAMFKPSYTDAGVTSHASASPSFKPTHPQHLSHDSPTKATDPNIPSRLAQPTKPKYRNPRYVDRSMQTDPTLDPNDVRYICIKPPGGFRKPPQTRIQHLLAWQKIEWQKIRAMRDAEKEQNTAEQAAMMPPPYSPNTGTSIPSVSSPSAESRGALDDSMKRDSDADASATSTETALEFAPSDASKLLNESNVTNPDTTIKPPIPPFPSQAAHSHKTYHPPNGQRLGLHISNLPPPGLSNPSPTTPSSMTPSTMTPSVAQSPFASTLSSANSYLGVQTPGSGITGPSPVKKKLSLGDYMNRKNNQASTPTIEKAQPNAAAITLNSHFPAPATMLKPNDSILEEAKAHGVEDSPVVDSPSKDAATLGSNLSPPVAATPYTSTVSRDPRLQ